MTPSDTAMLLLCATVAIAGLTVIAAYIRDLVRDRRKGNNR